jgi:hypothetical protein
VVKATFGKALAFGFDVVKVGKLALDSSRVFGSKSLQYMAKTFGSAEKIEMHRKAFQNMIAREGGTVVDNDVVLMEQFKNDKFLDELYKGEIIGTGRYVANKVRNKFHKYTSLGSDAFKSLDVMSRKFGMKSMQKLNDFLYERNGMRSLVESEFPKEFETKYGGGKYRDYERELMNDPDRVDAIPRLMQNEFDEANNIIHTQDSLNEFYKRNPELEAYDASLLEDEVFVDFIKTRRKAFDFWYNQGRAVLQGEEQRLGNNVKRIEDTTYKNEDGTKVFVTTEQLDAEITRFLQNPDMSYRSFMNVLKERDPNLYVGISKIYNKSKDFQTLASVRNSLINSSEKIKGYYPGMLSQEKQTAFINNKATEYMAEGMSYSEALDNAHLEAEKLWRNANKGRINDTIAFSKKEAMSMFQRNQERLNSSQRIALEEFIGKNIDELNIDSDDDVRLLESAGFFYSRKHAKLDDNGAEIPGETIEKFYIQDPEQGIDNANRKLRGYIGETPSGNTSAYEFWGLDAQEKSTAYIKKIINGEMPRVSNHSNFLETRRQWNVPLEFLESNPRAVERRFSDDIAARITDASHGMHNVNDFDRMFLQDIRTEAEGMFGKGSDMSKRMVDRARNAFIVLERDMDRSQVYDRHMSRAVNYLRNFIYSSMAQNIAAYDYGQVPVTLGAMTGMKAVQHSYAMMLDPTKYNNAKHYLYKLRKIDKDFMDVVSLNEPTFKGMGGEMHHAARSFFSFNSTSGRSMVLKVADRITGMDRFNEHFVTSYARGDISSMHHANASMAATAGIYRMVELGEMLAKLGDESIGTIDGKTINKSSILDSLRNLGVDIKDPNGDVKLIKEYGQKLNDVMNNDFDLTSSELSKFEDIIDKVIIKTTDDYTARNKFNRAEWMQSSHPMAQLASTFMSYQTNQYNIIERTFSEIERWKGISNDATRKVPMRKLHKMFKDGKLKELKDMGFTQEQLEQYPVEAMDRVSDILLSVPVSAFTRMSMNGLKIVSSKVGMSALATMGGGLFATAGDMYKYDQDREWERLKGIPVDATEYDDDSSMVEELSQIPEDVWDAIGTSILTADFLANQYYDTGNMGPVFGLMKQFSRQGEIQAPVLGTTFTKMKDFGNAAIEAGWNAPMQDRPMDINVMFNGLRAVDSRFNFYNKSQRRTFN